VASRGCPGQHCARHAGTIRWARALPGSWIAQGGTQGTVPAAGEAYAAVGGGVAAVGFGTTVAAYRLSDGRPRWSTSLPGFPPGAAVMSVRSWDGVVTAGVSVPGATGTAGHREEVVLSAATGRLVRAYPAAAYGGAVFADEEATVVVGAGAVTSYANATGKARWRVRTGRVAQSWRVSGTDLFVTVAAGGYLGAAPVTALRRINLLTGEQAILRPAPGEPFTGALTGAIAGTVLFSGPDGLRAYSGTDGRPLWRRAGVVLEAADAVRQVLYVAGGKSLVGLDPLTGKMVTSADTLGAAGLYAVSNGVALGLDQGALGDAWGYKLTARRVVWTARAVPWPHFFVDLSGLGGSADPGGSSIVLAACARLGSSRASGIAPPCARPELVAVGP
jgi:outer membrane protein assembly factor BamB